MLPSLAFDGEERRKGRVSMVDRKNSEQAVDRDLPSRPTVGRDPVDHMLVPEVKEMSAEFFDLPDQ